MPTLRFGPVCVVEGCERAPEYEAIEEGVRRSDGAIIDIGTKVCMRHLREDVRTPAGEYARVRRIGEK